jgi:hypothetical protein
MNNDKKRKEVVAGKVAMYFYLTLIIKELRISVVHDRVVTTLNIIKHFRELGGKVNAAQSEMPIGLLKTASGDVSN